MPRYQTTSVPLTHPLAMANGTYTRYGKGLAYTHKLKVYEAMGMDCLSPRFNVHHRDEDKHNNEIDNLVWFKTHGLHTRHHWKLRRGLSEAQAFAELEPGQYRVFDTSLLHEIDRIRLAREIQETRERLKIEAKQ